MIDTSELLFDLWYVAAPSAQVKRGGTLAVTLLGQQVLLGRDNAGEVFALRDFCPHRGMPLRYGTFDGEQIECCYHGWCFDTQGACTKVPSLAPTEKTDISRIKVAKFPCREVEGAIWVYVPRPGTRLGDDVPEVPVSPGPAGKHWYWVESVSMPCPIDHAVIGLMDPSHGPFVHASWWWRTKRSMHLKEKHFEPTERGFKMVSHKPSSNSRAYKILGGDRMTEIAFQLPALRTEHIVIGKNHIVLLTALTPVDEKNTILHQFMWTNIPLINMLKPLLKPFGKAFIGQDVKVVKRQQEGLKHPHPALLLVGDADQQALWYFKLKKEWLSAAAEQQPFENSLRAKTLRWYS